MEVSWKGPSGRRTKSSGGLTTTAAWVEEKHPHATMYRATAWDPALTEFANATHGLPGTDTAPLVRQTAATQRPIVWSMWGVCRGWKLAALTDIHLTLAVGRRMQWWTET